MAFGLPPAALGIFFTHWEFNRTQSRVDSVGSPWFRVVTIRYGGTALSAQQFFVAELIGTLNAAVLLCGFFLNCWEERKVQNKYVFDKCFLVFRDKPLYMTQPQTKV